MTSCVCGEPGRIAVEATPDAAEFIKSHDGTVYMWIDGAGVKHVRFAPPRHVVELERVEGDGFVLFQDIRIDRPRFWAISLRRFPLRRLEVLFNGVRIQTAI